MKDFVIKVATEHQINSVDISAGGVGILAWLKWAPDVAGAITVVWLSLRIFIAFRDEVFGKKKNHDDQ